MIFDKTKKRAPLEFLGFSPSTETMILAVFVGVLGSFGALFFKNLIAFIQHLFWQTTNMSPESLLAVPVLQRIFMPAIGGLFVGLLIYFLAREAKGHGVPEVMAAVITKNGIILIC